jgi:hypothetical protein
MPLYICQESIARLENLRGFASRSETTGISFFDVGGPYVMGNHGPKLFSGQ